MDIKIRIGASVDGDIGALVFEPMVAAAKRARAKVRAETGGTAKDAVEGARGAAKEQASVERQLLSHRMAMDKQVLTGHVQRTRDAVKQEAALRLSGEKNATAIQVAEIKARASAERTAVRQVANEQRQAARQTASERRVAERAERAQGRADRQADKARVKAEEKADKAGVGMFTGTIGGGMRNFAGVARHGVGLAADMARGAGVDLNVSSMVGKYVGREKLATDITNSAYMPGQSGAAGKRQDPRALMAEADVIGKDTATDSGKVLEGIQKFVGKTGDLASARAIIGDMAKLSRATGTSMEDMVDAAGDVAANLGDVPDKATAISQVMKAVAGGGKQGAIEIRDMATQMAGLAASAGQFEGDRGDNIALLASIAQESRQKGGSKSAAQSVTSVQSMMGTFGKEKRLGAFKKEGVEVYTDKSQTQVRNVQDIITESIGKTKGNLVKMNRMFSDVRAQSAVKGFAMTYNDAKAAAVKENPKIKEDEAHKIGMAAVTAEFDKLKNATMGAKEIEDSFQNSMKTAEAKAQLFQNQLQLIADSVATKVLPKLEELGPKVAKVAEAMGGLVTWAAGNPWKAAGAALAGSISKAGFENVLQQSMGAALTGAGGALGTLGAASLVAAAAVTAYAVGVAAINAIADAKNKDDAAAFFDSATGTNAGSELRAAKAQYETEVKSGAPTPATAQRLELAEAAAQAAKEKLEKRVEGGEHYKRRSEEGMTFDDAAKAPFNSLFDMPGGIGEMRENSASADDLGGLKASLDRLNAIMGAPLKVSGTVDVANMPEGGVPGAAVNPVGRSP